MHCVVGIIGDVVSGPHWHAEMVKSPGQTKDLVELLQSFVVAHLGGQNRTPSSKTLMFYADPQRHLRWPDRTLFTVTLIITCQKCRAVFSFFLFELLTCCSFALVSAHSLVPYSILLTSVSMLHCCSNHVENPKFDNIRECNPLAVSSALYAPSNPAED